MIRRFLKHFDHGRFCILTIFQLNQRNQCSTVGIFDVVDDYTSLWQRLRALVHDLMVQFYPLVFNASLRPAKDKIVGFCKQPTLQNSSELHQDVLANTLQAVTQLTLP